jgi:predicted amidophosphoribosyltransferase
MFAPLGRARRRKSKAKADKVCMTAGCGEKIDAWKWLCDRCFRQLPALRRMEICGAREQRAPHRVFGLSKDAAEWLADRRNRLAGE